MIANYFESTVKYTKVNEDGWLIAAFRWCLSKIVKNVKLSVLSMKSKIKEILIIEQNDKRTKLRPDKVVEDIEKYRTEVKESTNAKMVFFNIDEIPENNQTNQ